MPANPDDPPWLRAARRGDERAFAQLVSEHERGLLSACRRMLGDDDLARDAAQEATIRAWLGLARLRDDASFGAWLIGIGLNVSRGMLATRRGHGAALGRLDPGGESAAADVPAETPDPVDAVIALELTARVRAAIAALPDGQRQAVARFYLAGLTQTEIAEETGSRPGAVKTSLYKARRSLRASLTTTYEEYVKMPDETTQTILMRVAELRRTAATEPGAERHVMFLEAEDGRRLRIWIGAAEATALALTLEEVELPRPGVYQFTAALLHGAGATLREIHITELTDSIFYARAILADGTSIDARPSDAITLALVAGAPIRVDPAVLDQSDRMRDAYRDLIDEAEAATDDAGTIAEELEARYAATRAEIERRR